MPAEVTLCTQITDEIVAAFNQLIPQLSSSARIPTRSELEEIAANESLFNRPRSSPAEYHFRFFNPGHFSDSHRCARLD